jgi:hypothetical protein
VFFSLSGFAGYVVPELAEWSPLRAVCAVFIVAAIALALFIARKRTSESALNSFCVFLAAALLISPKSDMHHLALLYPGAVLVSLDWHRNGKHPPFLAFWLFCFWVSFLVGTVWRTGPMIFISVVMLVSLLIGVPDLLPSDRHPGRSA